MKNNLLYCIALLCLLGGCTKIQPEQPEQPSIQQQDIAVFQEEKIFGSYEVYDDWIFLEHYSDEESAYYIKKGDEITNKTTNISVEYRQNQYQKQENDTLTSAILYQLKLELSEELYQNMITESFTTKNDNFVFRVEVEDKQCEPPVKTIQYYIAGEKAHVLVQVTDFRKEENVEENAEENAKNIVESFVWREFTL